MFDEYIKILKERKKTNKEINKYYKKLIKNIILLLVGVMFMKIIVPTFPFLIQLIKTIDGVYQLIVGKAGAVITPIIPISMIVGGAFGTLFNSIKLVRKNAKLKQLEYDEEKKLLEISDKVNKFLKEKENAEDEIYEVHKETKEILTNIKNKVLGNDKKNVNGDSKVESETLAQVNIQDNDEMKSCVKDEIKSKRK